MEGKARRQRRHEPGGYKTKSTPCLTAGYIYFQGIDNKLWKVPLNVQPDGAGGTNLGGYETSSTPCVASGCVYFADTDSKLWRINLDGSEGENLGNYQTDRTPFVAGNYIYFQGTDNTLWRINLDGSGGVHLGGYDTWSTPVVAGSYIYISAARMKSCGKSRQWHTGHKFRRIQDLLNPGRHQFHEFRAGSR